MAAISRTLLRPKNLKIAKIILEIFRPYDNRTIMITLFYESFSSKFSDLKPI